jgi:DNA-directed RNA polymerase subunit RPC12/RpoP
MLVFELDGQCSFCGKSFEEGASMNSHLETTHGDEIFRCRYCSCSSEFSV